MRRRDQFFQYMRSLLMDRGRNGLIRNAAASRREFIALEPPAIGVLRTPPERFASAPCWRPKAVNSPGRSASDLPLHRSWEREGPFARRRPLSRELAPSGGPPGCQSTPSSSPADKSVAFLPCFWQHGVLGERAGSPESIMQGVPCRRGQGRRLRLNRCAWHTLRRLAL